MSDLATAPAEPAAATDVAPAVDDTASLEAVWDRLNPAEPPPAGHNGGPEIEHQEPAAAEAVTEDAPTRDERGRFVAKQEETQAEAPQPEAVTAPESGAPEGWPADAATQWDKLPKAVQEALKADLNAGRLGRAAEPVSAQPDPLRQVVEPYSARLTVAGVSPEQYVQNVLATADALDRDPVATLRALAQHYRVDLATLAPAQPATQQWVDPEVQALRDELAALKGQIAGVTQAEQARIAQSATAEVNAWAKDKPHFSAVRGEMAKLVQAGYGLDDAYAMACARDPKVREAQTKEAEAKRREDAARHAAQAAKAASVNVRSAPVGVSSRPATIEESLERAWDRIHAA